MLRVSNTPEIKVSLSLPEIFIYAYKEPLPSVYKTLVLDLLMM